MKKKKKNFFRSISLPASNTFMRSYHQARFVDFVSCFFCLFFVRVFLLKSSKLKQKVNPKKTGGLKINKKIN